MQENMKQFNLENSYPLNIEAHRMYIDFSQNTWSSNVKV